MVNISSFPENISGETVRIFNQSIKMLYSFLKDIHFFHKPVYCQWLVSQTLSSLYQDG